MTLKAPTRAKPAERSLKSTRQSRPSITIAPVDGSQDAGSHAISRIIAFTHYRQLLTAIQVVADTLTIGLSFLAGYWLWSLIGPAVAVDMYEPESLSRYYSFVGVTLITTLVGLEVHGLYQPQRSLMNVREFELILKVWGKACLFTLGILFLAHQLYFSRGVFVLTWSCLLVLMMLQRYGFFKFNHYLRTKGFVETTALIYGAVVVGRKVI
jgi:FlaA1/EpsC-like NDP-sugar epimerase